jgi:predicted TIM-barrel fold metal-dependent hydrolase
MAHVMSFVTEGVFARFPTLKIVLYEGGIFWLPHVMWRFDKNWKAQRSETPWVTEPPSHYIRRHVYSSSYPLELSRDATSLQQVLSMIEADRTLLFGSAFPDWDDGDPFEMVRECPPVLHPRIFAENAVALYGERLLAPNRS